MKKLVKYPLLVLFAAFLIVCSIADMLISRREFSEMENRYLAQRPKFTVKSLVSNQYTLDYEKYINDQFVGRDHWITLKSVSESVLGKIENNGIVYGKEHHMFEKYRTTDERGIKANTGYLNEFLSGYEGNITFALIPNSYQVLKDLVPRGLVNIDQQSYINQIYSRLEGENLTKLDMFPAMEQAVADAKKDNPSGFGENGQQAYYRTDHHWTTYGAYYGYVNYVRSLGMEPIELDLLQGYKRQQEGFYGSYYSKAKLFSTLPDTIDYYEIPVESVTIEGEEKPGLYDEEQWGKRDKYAAFLYGNHGVTVIKTKNNQYSQPGEVSRVLVVKDSYANCFVPFLTYNFDEVLVVDLRSLPMKMSELLGQYEFDDILIMYNFMNYASDTNIAKIKY